MVFNFCFIFFNEELMKIIYKVFALMAVIAFVGCATTGGSGGSDRGSRPGRHHDPASRPIAERQASHRGT